MLLWMVNAILTAQLAFGGRGLRGHGPEVKKYNTRVATAAFCIDMVSLILWLFTAFEICLFCYTTRSRKRQGGRMTSDGGMVEMESLRVVGHNRLRN